MSSETLTVTCQPCMCCGQAATVIVVRSEYEAFRRGELIQRAMPSLPEDERELLITGTHSKCWDQMFEDDDDE